jgi:hypothetical protein
MFPRLAATLLTMAASTSAFGLTGHTGFEEAKVSHSGSQWTIRYRLHEKAEGWVFPFSAVTFKDHKPWREPQWRVLTPHVAIVRKGDYDLLVPVGQRYVPKTVRIEFTPTNATLDREYDPAVAFSNGAVALYSDQFDIVPLHDARAIEAKPSGLSVEELGGSHAHVSFHDAAGPVFVSGRRENAPMLSGAETYVIFGATKLEADRNLAMLADPELPAWLKTEMASFAPKVAAFYTARLGERKDKSLPLLLLAWRGATPGKVINDGGVRPGEILLNFEGEGLLDKNEAAERRARWFIAHEMAHFWLGTSGVAYRTPSDAWITEGGAEMMAFTFLAGIDHDYAHAELQRAVDDCSKLAAKPVGTASTRHESRALYACGAVFALAGTGAVKKDGGQDFFDFIRPLLQAHQVDRTLGGAEWLSRLEQLSDGQKAAAVIRRMLDQSTENPNLKLEELFQETGIPFIKTQKAPALSSSVI